MCNICVRALQERCSERGIWELSKLTMNPLRGSFYPNSYAYIESNVQYVPPCFGLPSVYLTAAAFCPCQGTSSGLVDTVLVCWLQYNTVPASSDCRKCLNVKGGDGLTGV